jgi:hypothetical protein
VKGTLDAMDMSLLHWKLGIGSGNAQNKRNEAVFGQERYTFKLISPKMEGDTLLSGENAATSKPWWLPIPKSMVDLDTGREIC